jgi:hypothetical protein
LTRCAGAAVIEAMSEAGLRVIAAIAAMHRSRCTFHCAQSKDHLMASITGLD